MLNLVGWIPSRKPADRTQRILHDIERAVLPITHHMSWLWFLLRDPIAIKMKQGFVISSSPQWLSTHMHPTLWDSWHWTVQRKARWELSSSHSSSSSSSSNESKFLSLILFAVDFSLLFSVVPSFFFFDDEVFSSESVLERFDGFLKTNFAGESSGIQSRKNNVNYNSAVKDHLDIPHLITGKAWMEKTTPHMRNAQGMLEYDGYTIGIS